MFNLRNALNNGSQWEAYAIAMENRKNEYKRYAKELEREVRDLKTELARVTAILTPAQIAELNQYVAVSFLPTPDGYTAAFDSEGRPIFVPIPPKPEKSTNGNGKTKAKDQPEPESKSSNNGNGNKSKSKNSGVVGEVESALGDSLSDSELELIKKWESGSGQSSVPEYVKRIQNRRSNVNRK